MKIGSIVLKLRLANTSFKERIGGAADLDMATSGTLNDDVAFVIPLADNGEDNKEDNSVNQKITERFGVVVALRNDLNLEDQLGLESYDKLHDIRAELVLNLVGYDMGYAGPIVYRGGRLVGLDRGWLWWQFEFEFPAVLKTNDAGQGVFETTAYVGNNVKGPEELDDLLKVFTQYIKTPSVKWKDCLEQIKNDGVGKHLPSSIVMDMTQLVDLTEQYEGGFEWNSWGTGFEFFRPKK